MAVACLTPVLAADSAKNADSIWVERLEQEREWRSEGLALIPHRSNYFLPITYNTTPHPTSNNAAQHKEVKYQLSVKVLILDGLFKRDSPSGSGSS
jgi:phospholipase A1